MNQSPVNPFKQTTSFGFERAEDADESTLFLYDSTSATTNSDTPPHNNKTR